MNQNKDYWFNFPGAQIFYLILAFVCIFFYFGSYYIDTASYANLVFSDLVIWYIFAILGFIFFGIWGMIKGWWNGKFVIIGALILLNSFLSFQTHLYTYIPFLNYILWSFRIGIVIYCVVMVIIKMKSGKSSLLWLFPVVVIGLTYLTYGKLMIMEMISLLAFIILALVETLHKTKMLRSLIPIGVAIFYLGISLFYYIFNPLLMFQDIKNVSMSVPSRVTSLVVEKDGKYVIENGMTGLSPIDNEFECWIKEITPLRASTHYPGAFVGFKSDKFKDNECASLDNVRAGTRLFPIILTDSCVYFTSQVDTYKSMANYKTSNNKISKMTALIYKDFIDLYQKNESANYEKLKSHQKILQEEYLRLTTDSHIIYEGVDIIFKGVDNNEEFLRELSRNISLGMFNALCSDLVINNDINTALTIFSHQFYLTFVDLPIFKILNTNYNIQYGNTYIKGSSISLSRKDTFEPWVNIFSMVTSFAWEYCSGFYLNKDFILETARNAGHVIGGKVIDKEAIQALIKDFEIIKYKMGDYSFTPTLKHYAVNLQSFMYQAISNNKFMPDYESYFLNRFNQITPLVPTYKKSQELYKKTLNLYTNRINKDIKEVRQIQLQMDTIENLLNMLITQRGILEAEIMEALKSLH